SAASRFAAPTAEVTARVAATGPPDVPARAAAGIAESRRSAASRFAAPTTEVTARAAATGRCPSSGRGKIGQEAHQNEVAEHPQHRPSCWHAVTDRDHGDRERNQTEGCKGPPGGWQRRRVQRLERGSDDVASIVRKELAQWRCAKGSRLCDVRGDGEDFEG